MASVPAEPRAVVGRLDREGRLIAADPELEALQREAGSEIGQTEMSTRSHDFRAL